MFKDFDRHDVALVLNVRGQVKFGWGKTVLGIANKVAVEPEIHRPLDPGKADPDLPTAQCRVKVKLLPVEADGIVSPGAKGARLFILAIHGISWPPVNLSFPRNQGVNVIVLGVVTELNFTRHLNRAKIGCVVVNGREVRRPFLRVRGKLKLPLPIEGLNEAAAVVRPLRIVAIVIVIAMGGQLVDPEGLRIVQPFNICIHE